MVNRLVAGELLADLFVGCCFVGHQVRSRRDHFGHVHWQGGALNVRRHAGLHATTTLHTCHDRRFHIGEVLATAFDRPAIGALHALARLAADIRLVKLHDAVELRAWPSPEYGIRFEGDWPPPERVLQVSAQPRFARAWCIDGTCGYTDLDGTAWIVRDDGSRTPLTL